MKETTADACIKSIVFACTFAVMLLMLMGLVRIFGGMNQPQQTAVTPAPTPERYGPPASAPTLDYESFNGLDPQTVQTMEERERNNDLEFRVEKLEREVRRLNQIVMGIPSIRIGAGGPDESNIGSEPPIFEAPVPESEE